MSQLGHLNTFPQSLQVIMEAYPLLFKRSIICSFFSNFSLILSFNIFDRIKLPFLTSHVISTIFTFGSLLFPILLVKVNNLYIPFPALANDSRDGVALPKRTGHL